MTGKASFGILGSLAAGVDGGQRLELGGREQRRIACVAVKSDLNTVLTGGPDRRCSVRAGSRPRARMSLCGPMFRIFGTGSAGIRAQNALVTRQAGYGLFYVAIRLMPRSLSICWGWDSRHWGWVNRSPLPDCSVGAEPVAGRGARRSGPSGFAATRAARLEELRLFAWITHHADLALDNHHRDRRTRAPGRRASIRERLHCQRCWRCLVGPAGRCAGGRRRCGGNSPTSWGSTGSGAAGAGDRDPSPRPGAPARREDATPWRWPAVPPAR